MEINRCHDLTSASMSTYNRGTQISGMVGWGLGQVELANLREKLHHNYIDSLSSFVHDKLVQLAAPGSRDSLTGRF